MRKLKITSLILVVVMLLGMIPMGIFSASAAGEAPTTVPGGSLETMWNYTTFDVSKGSVAITAADAANSISNGIAYAWRGATGFLVKIDTTAASNLFLQIPMSYGSFGWASYMRITTAQNLQGCDPAKVGAMVSDAYIYDGTSWTKQTTTNVDAKGGDYYTLPAGFSGYVYVPFDQWYWQGNGNNGNVNGFTTPIAGCSAEYFLSHFETPNLSGMNLWTDVANTMTVHSVEIVYADKQLAPTGDMVAEDFEWTSISDKTTWKTGFVDTNENGKQDAGEADINTDYSIRTDYEVGNSATFRDLYVGGKPGVGAFATPSVNITDISDATGVSVTIDATKLGTKQLRVRPYLQYYGGASDTPYREYMIINATGDTVRKGEGTQNFYNSLKGYESYSQFVTRTRGSLAYYKQEGSSTWTPLFATVSANGAASDGYFELPAGFKGEIYIPMESYWFCMQNNADTVIIPWNLSLIKDFKSFGLFNSLSAEVEAGETNEVTYSNYKIYRPVQEKVEIGTAEELKDFFNNLGNYAGKKVVLTNDIILNPTWDADTLTAPADTLNTRTASVTFAGTFDGQGHVISGLYLEAASRSCGLFGMVARNTQATVKNVSIVNSYIKNTTGSTAPGNHWAGDPVSGGSIFGAVLTDMVKDEIAQADAITDPRHVSNTKATIENVYSDVNITTTASRGNGMTGYGGLVGIVQSDLYISGSTYAGTLNSTIRGTAGLVGSVYPPEQGTTMQKVNLTIDDSMVIGKITADLSGKSGAFDSMIGGAVGYANPACADITIRNSVFAAEMHNAAGVSRTAQTGYIYGGAWSAAMTSRTGGTEYQRWRLANVYVYDVSAEDSVTKAFGGSNGSLKVWWNDGGLHDWNEDGKGSASEAAAKTANADIIKFVQMATDDTLPAVLNASTSLYMYSAKASMVLGEALTYEIKMPVGWFTIAPNATIADAIEAQTGGKKDANVQVKLSDDKAYYVATFEGILPQDISGSGRRLVINITKYNTQIDAGKIPALTTHDGADSGSQATANNTVEMYLTTLYNDEATTTEAKNLIVDLLKYASATREFHGLSAIDTSELAGGAEFTTDDILAEGDATNGSLYIDSEDHSFEQIAFRCDTKLAVQIDVSAAGAYTATLGGEDVEVDTSKAAEGYILIYLNPLLWSEELQVTDPNTAAVLYYDLNDYFAWVVDEGNEAAPRQKSVVTALYGYMVSAQAYAESIAE